MLAIQAQFQITVTCMDRIYSQFSRKVYEAAGSSKSDSKLDCKPATKLDTGLTKEKTAVLIIAEKIDVLFSLCTILPLQQRLRPIKEAYQLFGISDFCTPQQEKVLHQISDLHALCIAEHRIGREYPYEAFRAIVLRQPLSHDIAQEFKEWIKKLQRSSTYISVGLLHSALSVCVAMLCPDIEVGCEQFLDRVSSLELYIISASGDFLQQDDPDYLVLMRGLQDNLTVTSIAAPSEGLTVYEDKNHPDELVVLGNNLSRVGVWRSKCTHFAWSIEPVKCLFQDPNGVYCRIEKVDYSLADVVWQSQPDAVSSADFPLIYELAKLLEFWATIPSIPLQVRLEDIFVQNKEGKLLLKVLPPINVLKSIEADYNVLEEFCFLFAKDNLSVHAHLMTESRLMEHPVARAYIETAQKVLAKSESVHIETEIAFHRISDRGVLDKAKHYCAQLKQEQQVLFEALRCDLIRVQSEPMLYNEIGKTLINLHSKSGFFSRTHPNLGSATLRNELKKAIQRTMSHLFSAK